MPKLRPFQRQDVEFIKANGLKVLVASAPGTGKTPVSIRALVETYKTSLPALVVCPASVVHNWKREIHRWAPGIPVEIVSGEKGQITKRVGPAFYVISWSLLDARWSELLKLRLRSVVADECHFAKNPDALRSQALFRICEKVKGVLLLSGTPIINNENELRSLNTLLGSDNPPMIRRLIEDVAKDIPPKKRSYLHINLRPRHRAEYDRANTNFEDWLWSRKEKLSEDGMADFEIERALAAEALTKLGYLRRLVGEFKVPAAADWIARAVRLGEPVVVFLEHQVTREKLSKALRRQRIRHCVVEGSTSLKKRQAYIDAFQRHEFPVFIGTQAAKEGITLTAARHLLFLERYYTSAAEEQAEDRIRRIGQKHKTTIWYLHALDTVDDRIDQIVKLKRRLIRTAIGSATTAETSIGNVQAIISNWGNHSTPREKATNLGLGEALPPLPRPQDTHAVVFSGERWNTTAAKAWCKMNGYKPYKKTILRDRFKLVVRSAEMFRKGTFETVRIARDIKVIVGKRLSKANTRRVVAAGRRR